MPPKPYTPAYRQVIEDIRQQIAKGDLKPGDRLPGGKQLQKQYGVSETVIRSALLVLKEEGVVEGRQGLGVFVADGRAWSRPGG